MANPEKEKTEETIGEKPKMEIRTMKKDLVRLRLLESEQEKDKIVDLQKYEKARKKDLERVEELKEQTRKKEEKRMKKIRLFRGREREKPTLVKTEVKPSETIPEEPFPPSKSLISAAPLPEFEKPSAALIPFKSAPALSPASPDLGGPASPSQGGPVTPKEENQNKLAPAELPTEPDQLLASQTDKSPISEKDWEGQRKKLLEQRQNIIKALSLTISEEKGIEQKIHLIEEEEAKPDLEDRQSIEKTRQYLEKQRIVIEQRRWQQEKQSQEIEQKINDLDSKSATAPTYRNVVSASGQEKPAPAPLSPAEEKPLKLPITKEVSTPKLTPEQKLAQAKQRLASFKERSGQAEKELETKEIDNFREKLKQSAMPEKKAVAKAPGAEQMFESGIKIYRDMPTKQPKSQKLLTRIVFILILLFVLAALAGLIYWLFTNWQVSSGANELNESPTITDIVDNNEQETPAPEPILPIGNKVSLEILKNDELPVILAEFLTQELDYGEFAALNVKQEKNFLDLNDFLKILEIQMPSEISEKLEPEFTIFSYAITSKTQIPNPNRLGFAAKIKPGEEIGALMLDWEQNMEDDTEGLFAILGKTQPAAAKTFSQTSYKNSVFRYVSFPEITDFGICWAIVDDYFVFTSSGEAMIKTIDLIIP